MKKELEVVILILLKGIVWQTINTWGVMIVQDNSYGQAMSQYLPYSRFEWLNQKEISDFCLNSVSENSSIGYILEVDLEYPSELHDFDNEYPLAPEKLVISQNMLSAHCSNTAN